MTDLPPLPRAAIDEHNLQGGRLLYTFDQMRAYGAACAAAKDAENERLRRLCSHAGILSAQEQHNEMMAAKDAEIERLRVAAEQARAALSSVDSALELGLDALRESADRYHAEMAGYRPERHQLAEDDYTRAELAWKAARDALRALDAALEGE